MIKIQPQGAGNGGETQGFADIHPGK